ncbi:hypothetical protein [Campylobacter upsaliensis]|uniref:hypothetical protein n=1 Tax=Campylobacter upsaliensis TaxID=28080 RepID=UPI002B3E745B|nr:hypothetical protein [Campylobacter upsaliensis]MEB2788715.1 hypothetical protein [Campylobacter upsaliensis]MEB2797782.1 hypothetical protein [Campylobacter upsaliensis]
MGFSVLVLLGRIYFVCSGKIGLFAEQKGDGVGFSVLVLLGRIYSSVKKNIKKET